MPVSETQIIAKLTQSLAPEHLEVVDESGGCGAKFNVLVVSKDFDGKLPLARHQLVHKILEEELKEIHALTIKAFTPAQYEKKKNEKL